MTFSIKKYIDIALTLSGLCLNYAAPLALRSHCWLSSLACGVSFLYQCSYLFGLVGN